MKNNKKFNISWGCDPEFFIQHGAKIVSSIPILKTDKYHPIRLDKGVNLYSDNALGEFTVPPVTNKQDMIKNLRNTFKKIQKHIGPNYKINLTASHTFKKDELKKQFGIDPMEIGCSAQFDAYKMSVIEGQFTDCLRSSSFHIHIGNEQLQEFSKKINSIKLLDIFVGTAATVFNKDETSKDRKKYYGMAGCHRSTDYGAEYRVLDSFCLRSPETTELVFDLAEYALSHIKDGTDEKVIKSVNEEEVIRAINTCDKTLSKKILVEAKLPSDLMARVEKDYNPELYRDWGI